MAKHRIGLVGKNFANTYGINSQYIDYFAQFGEVIIIAATTEVQDVDLLVLPGGKDVSTTRYQSIPSVKNTSSDPWLEYFDHELLPLYIGQNIPIFGICRGIQSLNIFFGGSVVQHIDSDHETNGLHDRGKLVHQVIIEEINAIIEVNSLHHQCITEKLLAKDLQPLAFYHGKKSDWSKQTKVVEALEHTSLPIKAVQWHPEEIWDDYSEYLIKELL